MVDVWCRGDVAYDIIIVPVLHQYDYNVVEGLVRCDGDIRGLERIEDLSRISGR